MRDDDCNPISLYNKIIMAKRRLSRIPVSFLNLGGYVLTRFGDIDKYLNDSKDFIRALRAKITKQFPGIGDNQNLVADKMKLEIISFLAAIKTLAMKEIRDNNNDNNETKNNKKAELEKSVDYLEQFINKISPSLYKTIWDKGNSPNVSGGKKKTRRYKKSKRKRKSRETRRRN